MDRNSVFPSVVPLPKTIGISLIVALQLTVFVITPLSLTYFNEDTLTDRQGQFCTVFSISIGDRVLFGNNEDYRFDPETSFISFVPPQTIPNFRNLPTFNDTIEMHGVVVVGSIIVQNGQEIYCAQGGMNDQGLCFDANSIPDEIIENDVADWSPMNAHWDVLWHCQTVEDVIDWYESHPVTYSPWNGQWNYVDASGNGVIVTATDGELRFIGKENASYLISTNFNRANPDSHYFDYPCWRYDTASDMLGKIDEEEEVTVAACRDVLDATHFEKNLFNDIETLYSTIYNPVEKEVYLYYAHSFDEAVSFDLVEEYSTIETSSANHSLSAQIFDRTYLMRDIFTTTQADDMPTDILVVLGLGGLSVLILALVVRRFRMR